MASYDFPADDYALNLLTDAAMSSRPVDSYGRVSSTSKISNQPRESELAQQRDNGRNEHDLFDTNTGGGHNISNLSNPYDTSVLSTTNMATLAFGSTTGNGHNPYMDSAFRGGVRSQISRNYSDGLGILNAETYNSGSLERHSGNNDTRKRSNDTSIVFGLVEPPLPNSKHDADPSESTMEHPVPEPGSKRKKKRKSDAISGDDDDEGKKKSRGRPRVDTKDETAADRRRTQIRMAQRAYRNRKETTISALEKKVQDLKSTNEEMSNIFISMYDFAVARGLLQREPEFGQQLQSTTQRFLTLAKAGSENMGDENSEDPEQIDDVPEEKKSGPPTKKGKRTLSKNQKGSSPPASAPIPNPPSHAWGGYQAEPSTDQFDELEPDFHMEPFANRSRDVQVITKPTADNASFPFDFAGGLQNYRADLTADESFSQFFFPQAQPALPNTYSNTEFSFGRRLLRQAMERALKLLLMDNPPPENFQRAFGFSLQYETKGQITARIRGILERPRKSSLQNWRAPFVHIGGAGTFYPSPNDVDEDLMPPFGSGFSQKPYSEDIAKIESTMDPFMKCTSPKFRGEFFDANDVEGYLRSRGLDIPEAAETITARIDWSVISNAATPKTQSGMSGISSALSPLTPKSAAENGIAGSESFGALYSLDPEKLDRDAYPFPLESTKWGSTNVTTKDNNIEPSFFSVADQAFNSTAKFKRNEDIHTITLNVQILISEIISHGVCLGRAPGFRPADVNAAIVAAVRAH